MDEWSDQLFVASFGGLELDILSTSDDRSRAQALHTFPFRDGAIVQDTGGEPRSTRCTIIFFQKVAEAGDTTLTALERFVAFDNRAQSGIPQTFVHPLTGSYQALVGSYTFDANAQDRSQVIVSCTFVEASDIPAVLSAGESDTITASVAEVTSDRAAVNDALAAAEAEFPDIAAAVEDDPVTVQDDAVTISQQWADDPTRSARQINLELNEITDEIQSETRRFELATDPRRYELWQSFNSLHGSVRRAADAAIKTAPRLTEHITKKTTSLLALMTELFGGESAVDKYQRTRELNDLPNPLRVEAGTKITIEQ